MRKYLLIGFVLVLMFLPSCHIVEHVKESQQRTTAEKQMQIQTNKQVNTKVQAKNEETKTQAKVATTKSQKESSQNKQKTPIATNSSQNQDSLNISPDKISAYEKYESKWKINLNRNEDLKLLEEMYAWYGTPYKYGGRTKEGTDCSGMTIEIYKAVYDIDLTRSSHDIWRQSEAVEVENLKDGDLVFFKINYVSISHVGIYISNGNFIHATTSLGVIISNLEEEYYKKRFYTGGRINK